MPILLTLSTKLNLSIDTDIDLIAIIFHRDMNCINIVQTEMGITNLKVT